MSGLGHEMRSPPITWTRMSIRSPRLGAGQYEGGKVSRPLMVLADELLVFNRGLSDGEDKLFLGGEAAIDLM